MANPRRIVLLCICIATLLSSGMTPAVELERPSRFLPGVDGPLVRVTNPIDGSTWAAWTYSNGSETDIAISRQPADGIWGETRLIGLDDGKNQRQPSLVVDGYGTTYLAYAERATGQIFVSALGLDAPRWTTPAAVTPQGARASSPALIIAANRKLVLGYAVDGRVGLRELSLLPPMILGHLGNDGPDVFGHTPWPPESDANDDDDDGLVDGDAIHHDVEYTGPTRRGRGRG